MHVPPYSPHLTRVGLEAAMCSSVPSVPMGGGAQHIVGAQGMPMSAKACTSAEAGRTSTLSGSSPVVKAGLAPDPGFTPGHLYKAGEVLSTL